MTRTEVTTKILLNKDYFAYFLLAIVLWIAGFWYEIALLGGAVLTFAMFDLIGYEGLHQEDKDQYPEGNFHVQSYRIMQAMFQVSLIMILSLVDYKLALGFVIIHFTAGCDILYDLIGRYPVCLSYPRTWLRWTPLGWFKKEIYNFGFITQAIIGLISAIILIW